jgi:superfamily II DNA/RNA helicase
MRIILVAVFMAMTFHITYICVYRLRRLLQEIGSEKENKTIIFVETKRKVDEITRSIRRDGFVL